MSADRYAVVGNPIQHSRSPEIHALFAAQTGEAIEYSRMLSETETFDDDVQHFFADGGQGLNITVPFKERAFALASATSDRAKLAGAVNTLLPGSGGGLFGDNTDGAGLLTDFTAAGWDISGQRLLVIGAGGAVRGVLQPLLSRRPESIVIANRTAKKAGILAQLFSDSGIVEATGLEELDGRHFDLVINCTSASLGGDVPEVAASIFSSGARAYDMVYQNGLTPFLQWAQNHGASEVRDGLGMLVGQAAESFFLWRGVTPDIAPVIAQLRRQLKS